MAKIIQLTGLSGAGKTSIASALQTFSPNWKIKIIDGDVYRQTLCRDLGFSYEDRLENIKRLGNYAQSLADEFDFIIIAAINPFNEGRNWLANQYGAILVFVSCPLEVLIDRDTKGLYKRALLPDHDPHKIHNLTGVNDTFEEPEAPNLILNTSENTLIQSVELLRTFLTKYLKS